MVRVCVIGCGYWGPNLVRNFCSANGKRMVVCADLKKERRDFMKERFPGVKVVSDWGKLLSDGAIDAVAIATPVSTHYQFAREAIEAGKHVLIEKPMTATIKEARELCSLARERNVVLMVDHTFIYTGAVRKMKEIIASGELGDVLYFDSVRVNLGLFQHDTNVVWDLAPHDLSIMDYLLETRPTSLSATGVDHTGSGFEDVAYVAVNFPNNLIAHFHVNWLSPVKVRQILIGGSKKMMIFNDLDPDEKIKVYDKGIEVATREGAYEMLVGYRTGDIYIPHLDRTEALANVARHFINCIERGEKPLTSGEDGLRVVSMLCAAQRSISEGGRKVDLWD